MNSQLQLHENERVAYLYIIFYIFNTFPFYANNLCVYIQIYKQS